MSHFLSREDILGFNDLKREEVKIPEWGDGTIHVRVMSGAEKDWWESANFDEAGEMLPVRQRLANMRARMAVLTVCDAEGTSLFTLADVDTLTRKCAPALDRIWEVATRLNRVSPAEEEALKNGFASPTPSDASGSGLP